MTRLLFFFVITYSIHFTNHTEAQSVGFKIFKKNTQIGTINGKRQIDEDSISYLVESDVMVRFIWKYERSTISSAIFKDDKLNWSRSKILVNDEVKENNSSFFEGKQYRCSTISGEKESIDMPINFTAIMMYFHEPIGLKEIYSESHLKYLNLEKIANNSYKLTLPNGDENHYHYENGKLSKANIYRSWFDLTFLPFD
ncbi:MAG: DUF6134 family protein [Bacteroidota bacterium]